MVTENDKFHFVYEQEVDDIVAGVKSASDVMKRGKDQHYVGSVPLLVAQLWAKECGAPIGTREYSMYAAKRLKSSEYQSLQANLRKTTHTTR